MISSISFLPAMNINYKNMKRGREERGHGGRGGGNELNTPAAKLITNYVDFTESVWVGLVLSCTARAEIDATLTLDTKYINFDSHD